MLDKNKIAVIGAGVMGPGIAQIFAEHGYNVDIWERFPENRERAKFKMQLALKNKQEAGELENADQVYARISFSPTMEECVKDAFFITEAIVEKEEIKRDIFYQLKDIAHPESIIASNTSALNIFEIAPPELLPRLLITHWYSPANLIPLVEVVKSEEASMETAETIVNLLKDCGKVPVLMKKFIRGYIVNRLQQCLNREIFYLIENGYCTAEDIDFAAKNSFIPRAMVLGLCKKIDFSGVDMSINNFKNGSYQLPEFDALPSFLQKMEDNGELGIKSGKGFYDYSNADMAELLSKRDRQLKEAFELNSKFSDDPV